MQYRIRGNEVVQTTETNGTIQNISEAEAEISTSADFTDSFVLRGYDRITFTTPLYVRAREKNSSLIVLNVLQNFFLSKGGEGLSSEDKEAISQSFKAARTEGNTVSFYMDSDTTGTPAFSFNFPEEIFLNQLGTEIVKNFSWSALAYPNSVNPNLDGKTVFVLAVKGDKTTNPTIKYSFVDMEKLIDVYTAADNTIVIDGYTVAVKISRAADNAIKIKSDGLHVDISGKVDKVAGKDLSTNDFTTAEKTKLAGIEDGAQVNVIESVKVNGTALTPASKAVNIDISGKVDKVKNATAGNVALLASDGTLTNSTVVGANILFKVSDATAGNVPILNSDGTLVNSTLSATDIVTKVEDATAGNIALFDSDGKIADSAVAVDGVIKKVAGANVGNIPTFDSDGGLVDSGHNILKILNPVRYGIRIKKTEPDPYARVEYIYDAVNFTPANMDFENDTFNFGSWSDVWFVKDIKPLMLKSDGTVDYYLYENDYSIKANGDDVTTPSTATDSDSDVANTFAEGNAMVQIPLIWVKRYEDDDYIYEIVSNVKWDKNYKAYAHTNASGNVQPYFYYSMFGGSGSSSSIRSLSSKTVSKSLTASQQIQGAVANGTGWYIHTWCQRELIRTLCILLGKSTDTQSVFGTGRVVGANDDSTDFTITTGTLMNKGMFYGISANTSAVKVFHIENFWGNQWDRTAGVILNFTDGYVYVKMTPEGEGYRTTDVTGMTKTIVIPAPGGSQYVQSCKAAAEGADDFGVIPDGYISGSDSTYYCDGYWMMPGSAAVPSGKIGYLLAAVGAHMKASFAGAFAFNIQSAPSLAHWSGGCGLSYIG